MKGEWCFYQSYLDKKTCDFIVDTIKTRPAQDALVGTSHNENLNTSTRRSKIRFVNENDPELGFLFDIFWKTAIAANHEFFNFHITRLDYIQIAEYDSAYEGEYKAHQDVFWISDSEYHRKLSAVIQLTDPAVYEGGELELFAEELPPADAVRQQGSIIYFPSFLMHQAKPVTKGVRYSIAAWFEGPKWR
jgi:PKHD-type hydroxylase